MKKIINKFYKIQDIINNINAFLLIIIMIVILGQTFFRFVIFNSIPWSEELSRYLFVCMIALGINIAVTKDLMVNIDIIDNYLSDSMKKIFSIIRNILSLIISLVLFISAFDMIKIGTVQKSPALQIPLSIMYIVLAFGFLLSIISLLVKTYEQIKGEEKYE